MEESILLPEDHLDDIVRPPIYSKRAIWGFSIFFSSIFGGILLMQNLRDINKKKEANMVLLVSILLTIATIVIVASLNLKNRAPAYLCNLASAYFLTEYFYKKYFPDELEYPLKKIWKPLIIGLLICLAFLGFFIWASRMAGDL